MPTMKTTILGLGLAALLLGLPTAAHAQISVGVGVGVDIGIAFPEPPPLVVVRPGVQLVPEYEEEVYFSSGYYWVRRDDMWYRTPHWRGGDWRPVRERYPHANVVAIDYDPGVSKVNQLNRIKLLLAMAHSRGADPARHPVRNEAARRVSSAPAQCQCRFGRRSCRR